MILNIQLRSAILNTIGQYTFCRTTSTELSFIECFLGAKAATLNILEAVEMHLYKLKKEQKHIL